MPQPIFTDKPTRPQQLAVAYVEQKFEEWGCKPETGRQIDVVGVWPWLPKRWFAVKLHIRRQQTLYKMSPSLNTQINKRNVVNNAKKYQTLRSSAFVPSGKSSGGRVSESMSRSSTSSGAPIFPRNLFVANTRSGIVDCKLPLFGLVPSCLRFSTRRLTSICEILQCLVVR